jgi:hypothetical protein
MSRITAIEDQGGRMLVRTKRWEPPPNPNAGPDRNGRLHVVAMARTDAAIDFAPLEVGSGASAPDEGGYSTAGSPMMSPRWRAVPNPDVTQAMIEEQYRRQFERSAVTRFVVEKRTIAEAAALTRQANDRLGHFTPESEVWVVSVDGDLEPNGFAGGGRVGTIGGTPDRVASFTGLIDVETGHLFMATSKPGKPGEPGMQLMLANREVWHVGDPLTFTVGGKLLPGEAALTISGEGPEQRWTTSIPFAELGAFSLPLDRAHVPWLQDVDVQKVVVELKFAMGGTGTEFLLARDPDAGPMPSSRVASGDPVQEPGKAPAPPPTDAELEAWARGIASDWKGTDVQVTSEPVALADLGLEPQRAEMVPAGTPLRRFVLRGTFPKVIVYPNHSGTGKAAVMAPRRLVAVVAVRASKDVLDLRAFPD